MEEVVPMSASPKLPGSNYCGFTLMELLVVIAIGAILLSIAMPNFRSLYLSTQRRAAATDLLAAFNQARSTAIVSNQDTIICARTSADTPTCSNGNSWQNGWLVYVGTAGTGNVLVHGALDDGLTLTGVTSPVTFSSSGRAGTIGTLQLCSGSGDTQGRQIDIARSGRVSISKGGVCS